jgi:hypothetical protein
VAPLSARPHLLARRRANKLLLLQSVLKLVFPDTRFAFASGVAGADGNAGTSSSIGRAVSMMFTSLRTSPIAQQHLFQGSSLTKDSSAATKTKGSSAETGTKKAEQLGSLKVLIAASCIVSGRGSLEHALLRAAISASSCCTLRLFNFLIKMCVGSSAVRGLPAGRHVFFSISYEA